MEPRSTGRDDNLKQTRALHPHILVQTMDVAAGDVRINFLMNFWVRRCSSPLPECPRDLQGGPLHGAVSRYCPPHLQDSALDAMVDGPILEKSNNHHRRIPNFLSIAPSPLSIPINGHLPICVNEADAGVRGLAEAVEKPSDRVVVAAA